MTPKLEGDWEQMLESIQVQTLMLMAAILRPKLDGRGEAVTEAISLYHEMLDSITVDRA